MEQCSNYRKLISLFSHIGPQYRPGYLLSCYKVMVVKVDDLIKAKEKDMEFNHDEWESGSFFDNKVHVFNQAAEKLTPIAKIAWPIILTSLLMYSKSFISMIFLGHLGDIALAGGSLSISFANITGYSVLKGLSMGMDPICYQAYGAKKWEVLTNMYKKTLILLILAVIPIALLWLNMEPILLWLGQDANIAKVATIYIRYSIPDLIAQANFHPLKTFLRTQNINRPITISVIFAMLLHYPINYFLVFNLNMGIKGVALASACNTLNVDLGMVVYFLVSKPALQPWDGQITTAFFKGWKPLLALAGPSVLSVCLEWWCYEILILLCSLLDNPQDNVAAMGILIQTTSLLYVVPSSLSSGLSIQVGHELGANQPGQAKQTSVIGLILAVIWGILALGLTTAVRDVWGKLFTSDARILGLTSITLPILGFCELGNSPQTAACGILVGSARPKMGCGINFTSFYLIGLPVAAVLAFKLKMGFIGLWLGLAAAQASCMCMMICTLVFTDWTQQANRAKELTQAKEGCRFDQEAPLLG